MTKFHINSKGLPTPCKATKGNCPFGGADSHYDNLEEAEAAANKINEEQFGIISKIQYKEGAYDIPINISKNKRIDKKLLLENNHSLRKSGDVWVHLDDEEKVVGIMKEPVILMKNNGELLEVVDNDDEEIQNSITKIKAMNLMSKFGLLDQEYNLQLYTPRDKFEEYQLTRKPPSLESNGYNAFKMRIKNKKGYTADLFNPTSEISSYFGKDEIIEPEVIDYNPEVHDWEKDVPKLDNLSARTWKVYNMDIQKINGKWAVVDNKGNLFGRMDNPSVVVNFDTETIESVGEMNRLAEECEQAKYDERFTKNDNKMLNRIALVKMNDKNNSLEQIRHLLKYSWAFKKQK